MVNKRSNLMTGYAAEAFVIYKLSMWGYTVSFAPAGTSYDLVADIDGKLLKVQVKGCSTKDKNKSSYQFKIGRGKSSKRAYTEGDYDIMAMVALPLGRVYFTGEIKNAVTRRLNPSYFSREREAGSWSKAIGQEV